VFEQTPRHSSAATQFTVFGWRRETELEILTKGVLGKFLTGKQAEKRSC